MPADKLKKKVSMLSHRSIPEHVSGFLKSCML